MKKVFSLVLAVAFLAAAVSAQDKLSPAAQQAKDLVKSGLAFYKDKGKDAAIAAFNDTKGKFRDGEYYLFLFDFTKENSVVCLARGDGNMALIGKDQWNAKDVDGVHYYQDFVKVAKGGSGWVDYKRTNPESKKIEAKSSYIERIPNTAFFLGCGFYKD